MITRDTLRAIALASSCLAPLAALAQAPAISIGGTPFTGEVGIGVMGVMGNNPDLAGRYSGLNTTGVDLLGNFDLTGRDPWDSGGTRYYELNGDNLVFQMGNHLGDGNGIGNPVNQNTFGSGFSNGVVNAGSLGFKAGDQGTWGIAASYNSFTYTGNVIGSIYTVNGNRASLNPGLFPYGGAASPTGPTGPFTSYTIPSLTATGAILPVQTGTRRDILGANFKYMWGDWTFTGAFRHEHKEGSMEEAYDGTYGGMAFAMPIDYDTDRYDATAAYTSRLFQGSLQYTFSHFTDNNLFVTLPYPVSGTSSGNVFQRAAAYETPPSNSAHYVTLMLATNAVPLTRINLNARVGVEKQDSTFPPNTADPGANFGVAPFQNLNSAGQGTTANSPDILATIYQVKISASSNPFANLDARAYYGIDGRSVSLNQYAVFGSGSGSDSSPGSAAPVAFVVPQDWLKQNAGAEVGYVIIPQYDTKLTVGYRFDSIDRSNAQVGHSWTNTASAALSSAFGPQADGRVSFDYADRSGTVNYLGPWTFLTGTPTFSGAYYQAPMTSEAVTFRANYTPSDSLFGGFYVQFKNENYTYSAIPAGINGLAPSAIPLLGVGGGLKQDYALSLGPDITYRPMPNLNLHFFYTYEQLFYNFQGNGPCATPADIANAANGCGTTSAGYDVNKQTSGTHTVGLSGEWKVNEKLKLKGDYTVSYGSVAFTEFNGVFVTGVST
ncbi:MtrB/PioB family outer membrane beta-barrel protein, partial [Mycobacterium sp.]|uniref:MtrB/PioB family outer membrane beta-barrel protein n=1 Tax=Mycobacterium sp. TaxID=1785 RepID=UPI003F9D0738